MYFFKHEDKIAIEVNKIVIWDKFTHKFEINTNKIRRLDVGYMMYAVKSESEIYFDGLEVDITGGEETIVQFVKDYMRDGASSGFEYMSVNVLLSDNTVHYLCNDSDKEVFDTVNDAIRDKKIAYIRLNEVSL